MNGFDNAALIWFVIGFAFFLLEFLTPGLIMFFFGIGAWITSLCILLFSPGIDVQLLVFLVSSVLTLLVFRRSLRRIMEKTKKKPNEVMQDDFIGKYATAETAIGPGRDGKIGFRGTTWQARSADAIQPGEQVTIVGNESILLIVKSINT